MKECTVNRSYALKHKNKKTNEIDFIDKDKAVEHVIRQLRQKKNIEVSPIPEKKSKFHAERIDQSNSSTANMISLQNIVSKSGVHHSGQTNSSMKSVVYLEIEDDEIEDYLEIDENVVEDLQALIPEEEIESISNSMIQPDKSTSDISEIKPENTEVVELPPTEPPLICDSSESKRTTRKTDSEELKLKIKQDEEAEELVEIQQNKDSVSEIAIVQDNKESSQAVKINNNNSSTNSNKVLPAPTDKVKTANKTSMETSRNTKKQKNAQKSPKEKHNSQNNKKSKHNSNISGMFKKITDFFDPDIVKIEEDAVETNEVIENPQNSIVEANSSEDSQSNQEKLKTRTLRSKSKVPQVSKIGTSQNLQNSKAVKKTKKEQISVESTVQNTDDLIQAVPESAVLLKENSNTFTVDTSSKTKFENRSRKGSSAKILPRSKIVNNNPDIVENSMLENTTSLNVEEKVSPPSLSQNEETVISKSLEKLEKLNEIKDSNENHLFTENSVDDKKSSTLEKLAIKRKRTSNRKKAISPIIPEATEQLNETEKEQQDKQKTIQNVADIETNQIDNGKRKTRNKIQKVQEDSEPENVETKLEIYDFDDSSDEEIEYLKKSVKNRKRRVFRGNQIEKKNSEASTNKRKKIETKNSKKNEQSPAQMPLNISDKQEHENINNNGQNTSVEVLLPSEIKSDSPNNQSDLENNKTNNAISENSNSTPSLKPVKVEADNKNWKPLYGPYKRVDRCNVCLLSFTTYKRLRAHKKIHEVENPYQCKECGASFEDVDKLAGHLRIHKGLDEEMNLIELQSENDDSDVKPMTSLSNNKRTSQRVKKMLTSAEPIEESSICNNETSEEPNNIRETRSLRKRNREEGIQTKRKEVKKKLSNAIKEDEIGKQTRVKRKYNRSNFKTELKKEQEYDSDEFLECYKIPVEDQDEYSQIDSETFPTTLTTKENKIDNHEPRLVEVNSVIIDYEKDIEDQEEYSQEIFEDSEISDILTECTEDMDIASGQKYSEFDNNGASSITMNEIIEEEYVPLSNENSDLSLMECEDDEETVENDQESEQFDASVGMVNEMAEAEYLLEKDSHLIKKERKKYRRMYKTPKTNEPKIIKINRDNLPPLILKSIKKKTLLLGKMPFACKKCDATFWTSFQLEKHQLVHVLKKAPPPTKPPSKVFKCEECGKEFKKICDLERHTRVHTGEKPSVCNICNKRFQQSYNLNKHLYTHTQEKNFECVICQKKFGRNDVLNRHVLTHSIVKPFKCSICLRTFIRNSQLKLHLNKHHGLDEDPGSETNNTDDAPKNTENDEAKIVDEEAIPSTSTD